MSDHERAVTGGGQTAEQLGAAPSDATLRALFEQAPVTIYVDRLDEGGSNAYMCPQLRSMLGYSVEEWASDGELWLKAIHPADRERVITERRRTREAREPFRMEYRMIARDGTVRWFRDEATVIRDGSATPNVHYGVLHDITDRKELEDALRRSEEELRRQKRYREIVEQIPLVTYIDEPAVAPSIYISPQVESLLGYSADEWLADPELFFKLLHPDDHERVLADHEKVFAAGESSWSFEYRLIARDGRTVAIRDEAVVIKDDEGNPLYVQGFLMDVTKRKEAEEALRRSEMRLRAMFEEAPIGIAWGPLDGSVARPISGGAGSRLYTRNRAYTEMLGYTEEELAGMHFTEYTHPDDLPKELELYGELIAGQRDRLELEKRYIRKDGREIWAHVVESAVRDEGGASRLGLTMAQERGGSPPPD